MLVHRYLAACAALTTGCAVALSLAIAPAAQSAPPSDDRGYLDSTARCSSPATAVAFGSTAGSRVAICSTPDGDLEYRGVRVRDGAKLFAEATQSADGAFTVSRDGVDYLVTASALVISVGERVIRDEPMLDFHRPGVAAASSAPKTSTTPTAPTTPTTPRTPLPPPLPAEVGGDGG